MTTEQDTEYDKYQENKDDTYGIVLEFPSLYGSEYQIVFIQPKWALGENNILVLGKELDYLGNESWQPSPTTDENLLHTFRDILLELLVRENRMGVKVSYLTEQGFNNLRNIPRSTWTPED